MKTTTTFVFEESDIKDLIKTYLGRAGYQLAGPVTISDNLNFKAEAIKVKTVTKKKEAANQAPAVPFPQAPTTGEIAPAAPTTPKPKRSTTT
jgi:DNA-binding winged helix-turn-helix (wHTH) protein